MSIEALVEVELGDRLEALSGKEVTSEEYKANMEALMPLLKQKLEYDKLAIETDANKEQREFDNALKLQQAKDERIDRIVKHVLTGLSIGSSIGLTVWGTFKTLKFEETGTITTSAGRNFIKNLFSKR